MKVVIASGIFPPDIGGPATSVSLLASAWTAAGNEVEVVTFSDRPDGEEKPYKVRRIVRSLPVWRRQFAFIRAIWSASDTRGPIFAQDGVASGLPAWIVARLRGRRLILRIAGDYAWERAQVRHGYDGSLESFQTEAHVPPGIIFARALQRFIYRRADLVIAPSRYLAGIVHVWGVPGARIRVIYNGVETMEPHHQDAVASHEIVAAGRLVPWKRFDVLIKAMAEVLQRVPDATLTIVGDGPERARLEVLAEAPMLHGRVTFTGRLANAELRRRISASGVFALTSAYEGFSHQIVEAIACGAPVVASRAGGNPEVIEDGKTGLLVEVGDVSATALALTRMLMDRPFAARCAAQAREALGKFSVAEQVRATTVAVLGAPGLSVLLISRDGGVVEGSSRTAGRMRSYAAAVRSLNVIAIAAGPSADVTLAANARAARVDSRGGVFSLLAAIGKARRAARTDAATLVVAQDPFEAGIIGWFAARASRAPLLIEEHGGLFLSPYWRQERLKNAFLYPIGLAILSAASGLRAVSKKIEHDLRQRFPKKSIREIPVYTEPLVCHREGLPTTFGFIGRYVPQKNLRMLFAAFVTVLGRSPEARLIMAGAGPLEKTLRTLAAEYGIGARVTWMPYAERVEELYLKIGTYVLPSWYEGWGRVAVEAMMCGIPVVMTDVGCAGELVRDGIEGRIVPVGDTDAFAAAMLHVSDAGRHPLLSAAAKHRAETVPTPAEITGSLTDFWKEIASL